MRVLAWNLHHLGKYNSNSRFSSKVRHSSNFTPRVEMVSSMTPRGGENVGIAEILDTPTSKVVRANSAPQKRLEDQLLSLSKTANYKKRNDGTSSIVSTNISLSSDTNTSSTSSILR